MTAEVKRVDAHCHLDLLPDFEEEAALRDRCGVWTLAVTTLPQAWERNREVASQNPLVEAALGIHPELVTAFPAAIDLWTDLATEASFIGEVGLDARPRHRRSMSEQVTVLGKIFDICSEQGRKVLTIHSAGASKEVLSLIEERLDLVTNRAILHWFTGSGALFSKAVSLGCMFSVNVSMLGDPRLVRQLETIPKSRILPESDAPFLPSSPEDPDLLVAQLGSALGLEPAQVESLMKDNLGALLEWE